MTEPTDEWTRRMVGLSPEDRARLEKPRAEERARRRWGVRETRPTKDLTE